MAIHALIPRRFARRFHPAYRGPRHLFPSDFSGLFDEVWRGFAPLQASGDRAFIPEIDVTETDGEVRLTAELPGLEEKDFEVSIEGEVLMIKGEKKFEREEREADYAYVERSRGSFSRAVRVPFDFDPEAVRAAYKNGVLTVTVPKTEQTHGGARRIPVTSS